MTTGGLPRHIPPMLAVAGEMPRDQSSWGFELKWDGVRVIAQCEPEGLRLETRRLRDVTRTYPELTALGDDLCDVGAVLDGEVVALDEEGRPSFQRLQERMNVADPATARRRAASVPVAYFVFDLLQLGGNPTIDLPYVERRRLLDDLAPSGPSWATPPWFPGDGDALWEVAKQRRLEGIVAKRLESTYQPGARTRDWLKIKLVEREEFVIGGWLPGEGGREGQLGSLAVGRYDDDGALRYCGGVGPGFTQADLRRLEEMLAPLRRDESPFTGAQPKRGTVFVEPVHVADVEFRERTREGILRQPSFKGLRPDKNPADVRGALRVEIPGG